MLNFKYWGKNCRFRPTNIVSSLNYGLSFVFSFFGQIQIESLWVTIQTLKKTTFFQNVLTS